MINNLKQNPQPFVEGISWDKLASGYLNILFQLTLNTATENDLA